MKLVKIPKNHLLDASAVDIEHIGTLANTLKTYVQNLAKKFYYKHVEKEQLSKFKARITMYSPYCYGNQTQDNSKCLFDVKTSPYIGLILEMLFGEWVITGFSYVVPVGVFKTSVHHNIDIESMSVSKLVEEYPHFIVKVKSVHVRQFMGIDEVKDAKRMNYLHYGDKNTYSKKRITALLCRCKGRSRKSITKH